MQTMLQNQFLQLKLLKLGKFRFPRGLCQQRSIEEQTNMEQEDRNSAEYRDNINRIKEEQLKVQAIKEKAESEKVNKLHQKEIDSQNKVKIQTTKEIITKE